MKKILLSLFGFILFVNCYSLFSQTKGKYDNDLKDSIFYFTPSKPLVKNIVDLNGNFSGYGIDLSFTESGFSGGFFWNIGIIKDLQIFANLNIGSARITDEIEYYDTTKNQYTIPYKINRLFRIPINLGLNYYIFSESIDSFHPYLSAGFGPTLILSNPYTENREPNKPVVEWFSSFGDGILYTKFGWSVGCGAFFGNINKSLIGASIKYYSTQFGGDGLESVYNKPIKNFGGIYLTLSWGAAY